MKVEVTNLVKTFDRGFRAVDGLSFSFSSGEVIGFVGPNGAGKTTTMRIMSTLDTPDSGDITLDGVSVLDHPEQAHRLIGFMPDDLPSRTDTTVDEYLDFFARAYGLRGAAIRKAVEGVEEFTGLTEFRDRTLHALSKGMKQRAVSVNAMLPAGSLEKVIQETLVKRIRPLWFRVISVHLQDPVEHYRIVSTMR